MMAHDKGVVFTLALTPTNSAFSNLQTGEILHGSSGTFTTVASWRWRATEASLISSVYLALGNPVKKKSRLGQMVTTSSI